MVNWSPFHRIVCLTNDDHEYALASAETLTGFARIVAFARKV